MTIPSNATILQTSGSGTLYTTTSGSVTSVYDTVFATGVTQLITTYPSSATISATGSDDLKTIFTITQSGSVIQRIWMDTETGTAQVAGDEYSWDGASSGNWATASNWIDTTTGKTPAPAAPGANSSVTLDTQGATITGPGNAAYLYVDQSTNFSGTFNIGELDISTLTTNNGLLQIDAGSTFKVAQNVYSTNDSYSAAPNLEVTGGTFTVSGTYNAPYGTIFADQSGHIQLANLASAYADLFDDATSSIEIGTAGNAAAGAITIDSGISLTAPAQFLAPAIINNGTITIAGGQTFYLEGYGAVDSGTAGAPTLIYLNNATLSGSGTIDIGAGSTLNVSDLNAASSQQIAFTGSGGNLVINGIGPGEYATNSFASAISGFATGDIIQAAGIIATSAAYSNGVLTLKDGTTTVASLNLTGSYAGKTFAAVSLNNGYSTDIEIASAPSAKAPTITAPASLTTQYGVATAVPKVSISDTDSNFLASGGQLEVVVSDTYGQLSVNSSVSGGGTVDSISGTELVITGTVAQVNADLGGLTDTSTNIGTDILSLIANDQDGGVSSFNVSVTDPPCYCRGTLILTEFGEVPVETLKIGDRIHTLYNGLQPIKWIGRRSYGARFARGRQEILPVCIKAGAFAPSIPKRDLWISPEHALFFPVHGKEILIEAADLVNGSSITWPRTTDKNIEYFHIELAQHDILVAEGTLAETFLDNDSRAIFQNVREYKDLYPNELSMPAQFCAPRYRDGVLVEAIRHTILSHDKHNAARVSDIGPLRGFIDAIECRRISGWAQNTDHLDAPVCLEIFVYGESIGLVLANRYRLDLKRGGFGNGYHGFSFNLPLEWSNIDPDAIEVRRAIDGAPLNLSHAAMVRAA